MTDTVEQAHTLDVEQIMDLLPHRYPFLMIDRVVDYSIKRPVVPGDQLVLDVEYFKERRGIASFKGVASVDGKVVCQADLMCAKH